eukprot:TRINITY_DN835_c1_g1_i2.p1 TRINITY_DN835_c1_g1~~TRINITY_DN835_c1_g1_i2.p1  ORF type:complete len:294 (+),score=70.39 TRINITY_DN835_c1_g1_i2:331-1212(+)
MEKKKLKKIIKIMFKNFFSNLQKDVFKSKSLFMKNNNFAKIHSMSYIKFNSINNYNNIDKQIWINQKRDISNTKILEKGRRSRIKRMRKKTDDQKDMERWNVDMSGEFSAVPMQYAERKKLEHEESQIEEARKLTKDYSDEELRKMKPKQLYSVIMRQCYAYKQVKRGWLDIYLERMDAPEQILEAEILIKKFQTNGWFGDHCLRLPEQVVDAAINMKRPDWALDFLRDNMTFRFFPRAETFQKLMNHYSSLGDFAGVLTVWQVQKNRGYHANKSTIHCLLKSPISLRFAYFL